MKTKRVKLGNDGRMMSEGEPFPKKSRQTSLFEHFHCCSRSTPTGDESEPLSKPNMDENLPEAAHNSNDDKVCKPQDGASDTTVDKTHNRDEVAIESNECSSEMKDELLKNKTSNVETAGDNSSGDAHGVKDIAKVHDNKGELQKPGEKSQGKSPTNENNGSLWSRVVSWFRSSRQCGRSIEPMDCSQQEESEKGIWGTPIDELSKMCSVVRKSDLKEGKNHTLLIDYQVVGSELKERLKVKEPTFRNLMLRLECLSCQDDLDGRFDSIPKPFPDLLSPKHQKWDNEHVQMPFSDENEFIEDKQLKKRWDIITSALLQLKPNKSKQDSSHNDKTSHKAATNRFRPYGEIGNAISKYCRRDNDFEGLNSYFKHMNDKDADEFFDDILPKMVDLALKLPDICTHAIPLLLKQMNHSVTMSQQQVACLLANAFFCTFPNRKPKKNENQKVLPYINFFGLYGRADGESRGSQFAKLDCLRNYFKRITRKMPTGTVTFKRQALGSSATDSPRDFPNWAKSTKDFTELHARSEGFIEIEGEGMLQVDFANKFLGGGALGFGCVQEEIRFMVCPEAIVSCLITEELDRNECLFLTGCERYSDYSGYAWKFRWFGDFVDNTPRDEWGRRQIEIVAIDALCGHRYDDQLSKKDLNRELNKSFCGFFRKGPDTETRCAVATGNWGCGAFGGDLHLKALIQVMAAAEAGRQVCYFTFGDKKLSKEIHDIHRIITESKTTVGTIWQAIAEYRQVYTDRNNQHQTLYEYISERCATKTSSL